MTALSPLSQTLLDYATSAAKRNWSDVVGTEHLLVAIRRWDEESFDQNYPALSLKLDRYLHVKKGQHLKPESVDGEVTKLLEKISDPEDLVEVSRILYESLQQILEDTFQAPAENQSEDVKTQVQESDSGDDDEEELPIERVASRSLNLEMNFELANAIAAQLKCENVVVLNDLASISRSIGKRILGFDEELLRSTLVENLGTDGGLAQHDLSFLIKNILEESGDYSSRLATRLGLAAVDVAEFAASLDEIVTEAEIEAINLMRIEIRELLGDRIDATSDAILEFEKKFSELVGLESVKVDLRKLVEYLIVSRRKASRGQTAPIHRMHMAFVGNPGTGKTTVARIFGQMLNRLGLIRSGVFVETDRAGLVGEYLGHTEKKTKDVLRKARGGVLFIDEAYSLNDRYDSRKGFGEEAVDVLVKEMEDHREDLAVIFAGYTNRMQDFLSINPGLKSRIPAVITFPDYSSDELLEISDRIAKTRNLQIDIGARDALRLVLVAKKKEDGFGNARVVENLIDAAQRNALERMAHLGNLATHNESNVIVSADIPVHDQPLKSEKFGFGRYI